MPAANKKTEFPPIGVTVESNPPSTLEQLDRLTTLLHEIRDAAGVASDDVQVYYSAPGNAVSTISFQFLV